MHAFTQLATNVIQSSFVDQKPERISAMVKHQMAKKKPVVSEGATSVSIYLRPSRFNQYGQTFKVMLSFDAITTTSNHILVVPDVINASLIESKVCARKRKI